MTSNHSPDVVCEELSGSALLVNARSGTIWRLNAAALRVWKCIGSPDSMNQLIEELKLSRPGVVQFCHQLAEAGLLLPIAAAAHISYRVHLSSPFKMTKVGIGSGPRRRPTPRGVSGPG